jgi:hypothetical protein
MRVIPVRGGIPFFSPSYEVFRSLGTLRSKLLSPSSSCCPLPSRCVQAFAAVSYAAEVGVSTAAWVPA